MPIQQAVLSLIIGMLRTRIGLEHEMFDALNWAPTYKHFYYVTRM